MKARAEPDREHRQSDYAGVFLHDATASVAETESALRRVQFMDVQVVNDPALVSRLVPPALRQDAASWLMLYSPRDASSDAGPHDALLLPFPGGHSSVTNTGSRSLADVAFRLVEVIRGSIASTWTPALGVQNIQQRLTPTPGHQEVHVPRFQLIHSDTPLFELPGPTSALVAPQHGPMPSAGSAVDVEVAIRDALREASAVKPQQSAGIRLEEASGERQSSEVAARLARINQRLYERIRDSGGEVVVPAVVEKFKGVMDPETAQFLISAATVARFVEQHPAISSQFDYSLPGSALCKAVEREAKRSIRWFLGGKLKNIKFENVETTLTGSSGLAQKLGGLLDAELLRIVVGGHTDALPARLSVIRKRRNSLAHIDAASGEEYSELLRLVLAPVEKPEESLLGIILRWKQKEIASGITL